MPNPTGKAEPASPSTAARSQPSRVAPLLNLTRWKALWSSTVAVEDVVDVDDTVGIEGEAVDDVVDAIITGASMASASRFQKVGEK